jgi:uptake hydrogenase large subunit
VHDLDKRNSVLAANLEGRIDIDLTPRVGVSTVVIRSSRPRLAQKLMAGCTPEEAAQRAGLIFSLCGKAQRVAAEAACEAAQNVMPSAEVFVAREQRVLIELAQEHAWHLLLNWPPLFGHQADMPSLLGLRKTATDPALFADQLDVLLSRVILGEPAKEWLTRDLAAFDDWRKQAATLPAALFATWGDGADYGLSRTPLLPPLAQWQAQHCTALAQRALANEAFCGQPEWQGGAAETGTIARMQSHAMLAAWVVQRGRGVGARVLARLLELAEIPQRLRFGGNAVVKAQGLGDNVGMSAIETSRGLLIHVVRLVANEVANEVTNEGNNKVADYRIVAPTEWNFHPAGSLHDALAEVAPGDDVLARAQAICQSLDPCVAFAIEVSYA